MDRRVRAPCWRIYAVREERAMRASATLRPMDSRPAADAEAFVPFETPRGRVPLARSFRSTWLVSSMAALRERGLIERYFAGLPGKYHEVVVASVAGVWLPVEVAVAHYEACEALHLPQEEVVAIGRQVTELVHKTSYSLAIRLVKEAGVTPWACLALQKRLWQRVWEGGDVAVFKLGPKEARVEIAGWPCSRVPYCRRALRGLLIGQSELFCRRAYASEIAHLCTATTLGYRIAWA
jgi:hypothetical protein